MEKVYISDAGPKVSPAIYGFYRWDDIMEGEKKMEQIVNLCLELGINTFDHADSYGSFQCEKLFGDLIITLLSLRQFFKYLSRKAEGIGPMKPWQPLQVTHL